MSVSDDFKRLGIFRLIPTPSTGNPELDGAVDVALDFFSMLCAGQVMEACGKYIADDFIDVMPTGLPYSRSVYEGVPNYLAFFGEAGKLIKWGNPTIQFFAVTPNIVINKIFDADAKVGDTEEPYVLDLLEESWLQDGKVKGLKPYYFDQIGLMKDQMRSKGSDYVGFKESEAVQKKVQLTKHGLLSKPSPQ